ncbi:type VI secretion system ATPase TssH [uncultured Roseobacter sp.]|uniref:type VI secretion system ATPase TssH n=1 Tax=uncultured Roseobacter sp. TaxID=114847 RepID=UPI00261BD631|nr:type VI secretion system ATPase TssH [uncultured Roseobacter sp.]
MTQISRIALFGKLNTQAFQHVENATVFCKMRGNPYVELAHVLHQILQEKDSDLHRILRFYELDAGHVETQIQRALDALPRGATAISDLSPHLEEAVERAWVQASLGAGRAQIGTGHLLLGLLSARGLHNVLRGISADLAGLDASALSRDFADAVAGSPEAGLPPQDGSFATDPGKPPATLTPTSDGALDRFCTDLTARARAGEIDPIMGRDTEIRQMIDVLSRRRQNNPILTGEAGVGKTAVVEGLALRIAEGEVPPALARARLMALDIGLLQAGAGMKGEFETRLRSVIDAVAASAVPVLLFIDETHTLVGAGGAEGTGDAANLLKPALARGTLRTIGATTWAEYKKHIEKDPALTRRFQVVQIAEPDTETAVMMMRGMTATLEKHHKVQILDEALEASVRLSARYIPARQLPDKSVSVLDTACARVGLSLHATPAPLEDCARSIAALSTELEIIARDAAAGANTQARRETAEAALAVETDRERTLTAKWEAEKSLVTRITDLRARRQAEQGEETLAQLRRLQEELATLQGETPMILPLVDATAVGQVVADWTGIPVGRMVRDEMRTVLDLADHLSTHVIGQDHAMEMIAKRVISARAGLDNPDKPIGVFLLAGSSGVGKTETALAIAKTLYGGAQNLITINMSEYQEAHTVSSLKGAPPGYVGYGQGGVLTEAVRRRPYSVVLLDEVEKAHPDVHEVFFQVFDKGVMEDGEGRQIDFRNTLILMTSNVGSEVIMDLCADPALMPEPDGVTKALRAPLLEVFPPALLGRMVPVPYYPLSAEMIARITRLHLDRIGTRVRTAYDVPFTYTDAVVEAIVARCREVESGGRMIDAIVTNTLLPALSGKVLTRRLEDRSVTRMAIDVTEGTFTYALDEEADTLAAQ